MNEKQLLSYDTLSKKVAIIIPTHSDYLGIVDNFLSLLRKNWQKCPFRIIVSICGENKTLKNVETIYNGKNSSLIDCLVNAAKKYKYSFYISFLGDAFINKQVNDLTVLNILQSIIEDKVDYCSLQYVKRYKKLKTYNKYLRYIHGKDRYSHNFVAFMSSRSFLLNSISKFDSDLNFEKHYLIHNDNDYFDSHLIVRANYFEILPGIIKGKWDRRNYKKLLRNNPEIDFEKREIQKYKECIIYQLRNWVIYFLPEPMRKKTKKTIESVFSIRFGMDERDDEIGEKNEQNK